MINFISNSFQMLYMLLYLKTSIEGIAIFSACTKILRDV